MSKATHPKYSDMIVTALRGLGGKGASRQAINKFIVKEYNLKEDSHHNVMLNSNLKRASVTGGPIVHSKGKGAAGSFRLRAQDKEPAKKVAKKPAAKKPAQKKSASKKPAKVQEKQAAKPKEEKKTEEPKPAKAPKAVKVKSAKKSKAASPKKPKAAKAGKQSPKKSSKKAATKK